MKHAKPKDHRKLAAALAVTSSGAIPIIAAPPAQAAVLNAGQVADLAKRNCPQLTAAALDIAVRVSHGESGWNTNAHNPNGEDSRGLWQINRRAHGDRYGDLFNADNNAKAMCAISNGGTNWQPWTVYTSGKWKSQPGWTGPVNTTPPAPAPAPSPVAEVLRLVNIERAKVGAGPLAADAALNKYAADWSATMAAEGRMYHSDLDFPGSPRGENVAAGFSSPSAVMLAWMNSPGHRSNILNKSFTKLGVGVSGRYWTQVFAGGAVVVPPPKPPQSPVPAPKPDDRPESHIPHDHYVVKPGDYLVKIATDLKVKGGWEELYRWNTRTIGPDPNLIHPGMELNVPSAAQTPAPKPPAPPAPAPKPEAPSKAYVAPLAHLVLTDGYASNGGCLSRSCGGHSGADFRATSADNVMSVAAGRVLVGGAGAAYGNHVIVDHGGIFTLYAHLSSVAVRPGETVQPGTVLGKAGSTGNSSGVHLHFEVRTDPRAFGAGVFLDPVAWLRGKGVL